VFAVRREHPSPFLRVSREPRLVHHDTSAIVAGEQLHEPFVVMPFLKMSHLVDDYILKAVAVLLHQFKVEPNPLPLDATWPRLGLHMVDPPVWDRKLHEFGPLGDRWTGSGT
jgi:hypothetical protein